jgi:hypothetical protein
MAADAFARPSSPNSFSFNDEMSSPGGANDMTRLPPENVKSMEEMQNEVEVLRKRLKRRNVLLDEVRRAYLNDVVTVKEEILRDTPPRAASAASDLNVGAPLFSPTRGGGYKRRRKSSKRKTKITSSKRKSSKRKTKKRRKGRKTRRHRRR